MINSGPTVAEPPSDSNILAERVRFLELSLRSQRRSLLTLGLCLLFVGGTGFFIVQREFSNAAKQKPELPDKIVAREVVLQDKDGKTRFSLAVDSENELVEEFRDLHGTTRLLRRLGAKGLLAETFFDQSAHPRLTWRVDDKNAFFGIIDKDKIRMYLDSKTGTEAVFAINDTDGNTRHLWKVEGTDDPITYAMLDKKGRPRIAWHACAEAGSMQGFSDESGNLRISLAVFKNAVVQEFLNTNGESIQKFGEGPSGKPFSGVDGH